MRRSYVTELLASAVIGIGVMAAVPAQAGTVILEGSDAIGFHCPLGSATACLYRDQVWTAIGGADVRPIAIFNSIGDVTAGLVGSGTHAVVNFATLAAAGPLSDYVALYFLSFGGCCGTDTSFVDSAAETAAITAYLALPGNPTVMIGDYSGVADWDFAVGAGGLGSANTAGVDGALPGPGCTDLETITPDGIANGFTQPLPMGCWTHQAYAEDFFGPLGFTLSFFDSDPAFSAANGGRAFSSLLSNGVTVSFVPEPSTLLLLGAGLLGLGAARRRKQKA